METNKTTWDGQAIESPKNVIKELKSLLATIEHPHTGRPQDDVPTNRLLLYIVKDYQRMQREYYGVKERADDAERELAKLKEKHGRIVSRLNHENQVLTNSLKQMQESRKGKQIVELRQRIEELKASRDAVIREMTDDLTTQLDERTRQLEEARRHIKTLAAMVADPDKAVDVSIDLSHTLKGDDEKAWLDESREHLATALTRLEQTEERLAAYQDTIKEGVEKYEEYSTFSNALKKINRAFDRIDSACAHIENFFDVVGELKL